MASKGAIEVAGRFVRYRYQARKREKYWSVRRSLSRPIVVAVSFSQAVIRGWWVRVWTSMAAVE